MNANASSHVLDRICVNHTVCQPGQYETKAAGDTFVTFTGTLEFGADNMSGENCTAFDPAEWTDGMPVDRFNGMQFGLGFGPITDYLLVPYQDDAESLEIVSKSGWASYIGMKHPASGAGGPASIPLPPSSSSACTGSSRVSSGCSSLHTEGWA